MSEVKLETLIGKTEEQAKKDYMLGLIASVKKKVILPILQPGLNKDTIVKSLEECNKNGYNSIIALPSYIAGLAKQKLSYSSTVGVVINYPLGENTISATTSEIKAWAKSGVDEIIVVLPLSDIKFNKCKISDKILKILSKLGKKKQVSVMVESCKLNDAELGEFAKKVVGYKIDKVYTSTGFKKENYEERIIKAYKTAKNNYGIKFVALNDIPDIEILQTTISSFDYVVCEKATALLEETLSKVSI